VLLQAYSLALMGSVFAVGATLSWLWPDQKLLNVIRTSGLDQAAGLPIFTTGAKSTAWWGMICLLGISFMAFGALFYSYFYIRLFSPEWPQGNLPRPDLGWSALIYALLPASAGAFFWAQRSFIHGARTAIFIGLSGSILLALAHGILLCVELIRLPFTPQANAYASLFYIINWVLLLYVGTGFLMLIAALMRVRKEHADRTGHMALQMQVTALFWYFTAGAALAVYAVLYLSPYLI
jgi:heme/copper-type cytochrome/quinol oxidase subunit 3